MKDINFDELIDELTKLSDRVKSKTEEVKQMQSDIERSIASSKPTLEVEIPPAGTPEIDKRYEVKTYAEVIMSAIGGLSHNQEIILNKLNEVFSRINSIEDNVDTISVNTDLLATAVLPTDIDEQTSPYAYMVDMVRSSINPYGYNAELVRESEMGDGRPCVNLLIYQETSK